MIPNSIKLWCTGNYSNVYVCIMLAIIMSFLDDKGMELQS